MTSAAYGVGRDSIADGAAEGCPVSPFFASTARLEVLPGEERAHPAHPDLAFWALLDSCGVVSFAVIALRAMRDVPT